MLQMIGTKLAVIPLFDPDKTPSGLLYIPEVAKERCDQGIVKYVGPDCKLVKPGDYVMFSGYTGTALKFEEEGTLILFHEEFVVAKIEGQVIDETEVPGLFFEGVRKRGHRTFFPETVEFALTLIAKALEEAPWRRDLKSTEMLDHRPKEAASRR